MVVIGGACCDDLEKLVHRSNYAKDLGQFEELHALRCFVFLLCIRVCCVYLHAHYNPSISRSHLLFSATGLSSATNKRLSQSLLEDVVGSTLTTSIQHEQNRLLEIAKYKRLAKEYKERLVQEKAAIRRQEAEDNAHMERRIQKAMARGREKEIQKLLEAKRKREMERARALATLKRKQERAEQEGNLMKLLRRGNGVSKIKKGKGIKGLSRHWKSLSNSEKQLFGHLGSSQHLGLSPARKKKRQSEGKRESNDL